MMVPNASEPSFIDIQALPAQVMLDFYQSTLKCNKFGENSIIKQ
jgi:hypothetical protein